MTARPEWDRQIAAHLAAGGVDINALPAGTLSAAHQEGASPDEILTWATNNGYARQAPTRNPQPQPATDAAPARRRRREPEPGSGSTAPDKRPRKPVRPAANLITIGLTATMTGSALSAFGLQMLWDGDPYLIAGAAVSLVGLVALLTGIRRLLAQRDRAYHAKGI